MDQLEFARVVGVLPAIGIYVSMVLGPCSIIGVAGGVLGIISPLRVPDWIQPVKNRQLFALVATVNATAFALATALAVWCVPRTTSWWAMLGAFITAGLSVFLCFRFEARHRYERVTSPFMRRFLDIRGEVVVRPSGATVGRWERVWTSTVAGVSTSTLTWMLGISSGIDLGQFSICVGGVTVLRVSAAMFA